MKKLPRYRLFFVDQVQIIFALVLVIIVFIIVYVSLTYKPATITGTASVSPSQLQTPSESVPSQSSSLSVIKSSTAVTIVQNRTEVKEAQSAAEASNTKFFTEIDSYPTSQNNYYFIHVFELIPDGNGTAHTATVGWYQVDPQTGEVTEELGM